MQFTKIQYKELNARQKEAYNFQKVSALLSEYGYITIRLSSDWMGADFIAQHKDGEFLKVQLKGRATVDRRYEGKDLHICFPLRGCWYLVPHDKMLEWLRRNTNIENNNAWIRNGMCDYCNPSAEMREWLKRYKIPVL